MRPAQTPGHDVGELALFVIGCASSAPIMKTAAVDAEPSSAAVMATHKWQRHERHEHSLLRPIGCQSFADCLSMVTSDTDGLSTVTSGAVGVGPSVFCIVVVALRPSCEVV